MSLQFPEHDDVVFKRAPLSEVLCQIEFPPILALSDLSGVTGFQEALRPDYPNFDYENVTDVVLSEDSDELSQSLPIWRLQDSKNYWEVSLGLNFIALSTTKYNHFDEFSSRLIGVLKTLERTLAPGNSSWIGLRKINLLEHPTVTRPQDWRSLIRDELLGLYSSENMDNQYFESATFHAKFHIHDQNNGVLTISHGIHEEDQTSYTLDIDYATTEPLCISANDSIVTKLRTFSDSITDCFHWCLKKDMIKYLEPLPRDEVKE